MRTLEGSLAVTLGTGKGAAHMTEQLALGELTRDRRAIEHLEGPCFAQRACMNGARNELLACASLTRDEHRRDALLEALQTRVEATHRWRGANELAIGRDVGAHTRRTLGRPRGQEHL